MVFHPYVQVRVAQDHWVSRPICYIRGTDVFFSLWLEAPLLHGLGFDVRTIKSGIGLGIAMVESSQVAAAAPEVVRGLPCTAMRPCSVEDIVTTVMARTSDLGLGSAMVEGRQVAAAAPDIVRGLPCTAMCPCSVEDIVATAMARTSDLGLGIVMVDGKQVAAAAPDIARGVPCTAMRPSSVVNIVTTAMARTDIHVYSNLEMSQVVLTNMNTALAGAMSP
jgi:hypothetical protein